MPDDLARFCAELPTLRAALQGRPELRATLDRAERAAREGEPISSLLAAIGIAASDGDLPLEGRDGGYVYSLPVIQHVVSGVYLCPMGRCQRVEVRNPGDPLPTCHLYGRSLRFTPNGDE